MSVSDSVDGIRSSIYARSRGRSTPGRYPTRSGSRTPTRRSRTVNSSRTTSQSASTSRETVFEYAGVERYPELESSEPTSSA
ncbi:hypothetical protein D8S78_00600 [Natrialba swarupiae]|nr:hypothetical protein [Natrialba swarupiae]